LDYPQTRDHQIMSKDEVPGALRLVLEQAQREQSPEEKAAWHGYILGQGTLAECFEAPSKPSSNGGRL
jgi:hypothetical protein